MINLDELMRLREAATPGPWDTEYRERENGMYGQDVFTSKNGDTIATIAWYPKPLGNGVTSTYRADNAAYICVACNAVPELVKRIRELEAQCDWLAETAANAGWHGVRVGKEYMIDQARIAVSHAQAERHECPTPETSCHARDGKLCMSDNHLACAQSDNLQR